MKYLYNKKSHLNSIMVITTELLNSISSEAKNSPRLRKNFNLHNSLDDKVHRFFNAMEPGTKVPIHRHQYTEETFMLVRGKLRVVFYDEEKNIIEDTILSTEEGKYGVHIPKGVWHWVEILESGTVTFEVKEGPYEPLGDEDIMKET